MSRRRAEPRCFGTVATGTDGTFAEVSCTFTALAGENTLEVVAENGVVIGNYGDLPSTSIPRPPGESIARRRRQFALILRRLEPICLIRFCKWEACESQMMWAGAVP